MEKYIKLSKEKAIKYDKHEKIFNKLIKNNVTTFENALDLTNKFIGDLQIKADKYDNLHTFSKNIDLLIKGKKKIITDGFTNIKCVENGIKIIKTLEDSETYLNIENLGFEFKEKQDYTLKFDYDKFEKLYDKECMLICMVNGLEVLKSLECISFGSYVFSTLNEHEINSEWKILKDYKQLNKDDIEEVLNDGK